MQKGSDIGVQSLYAQQVTIFERNSLRTRSIPKTSFCPRREAMKRLNEKIRDLQKLGHAIVLMLDANQAVADCYPNETVRPYSIEWLCLQRGLSDPFTQLTGKRPNSTTQTPNREIDYILTYGIHANAISTQELNYPIQSDHLAIVMDLDLASFFSIEYSDIGDNQRRLLTSGNKKTVDEYISYVTSQIKEHKLMEKISDLSNKYFDDPLTFTPNDASLLNNIDNHLTEIMLAAEKRSSKKKDQRQPWSPELR